MCLVVGFDINSVEYLDSVTTNLSLSSIILGHYSLCLSHTNENAFGASFVQ
jgi:hypothetical protein